MRFTPALFLNLQCCCKGSLHSYIATSAPQLLPYLPWCCFHLAYCQVSLAHALPACTLKRALLLPSAKWLLQMPRLLAQPAAKLTHGLAAAGMFLWRR